MGDGGSGSRIVGGTSTSSVVAHRAAPATSSEPITKAHACRRSARCRGGCTRGDCHGRARRTKRRRRSLGPPDVATARRAARERGGREAACRRASGLVGSEAARARDRSRRCELIAVRAQWRGSVGSPTTSPMPKRTRAGSPMRPPASRPCRRPIADHSTRIRIGSVAVCSGAASVGLIPNPSFAPRSGPPFASQYDSGLPSRT